MAFNIGLNVIEVDGRGAPAIAGAPTSIAGLILRSRRGPTDQAVRVSNFRQFTTRFGSYNPNYMGAYCVNGFFLNGGQEAYIARVVGQNSDPASATLQDRSSTPQDTLRITAGYRGQPEVGTWGNDLRLDIQDNPEFSTRLLNPTSGDHPAQLTSELTTASMQLSPPTGETSRSLTLTISEDQGATTSQLTIQLNSNTLPTINSVSAEDVVNLINRSNEQAGTNQIRILATVVRQNGDDQIRISTRFKGTGAMISLSDDGVTDAVGTTLNYLGFNSGNRTDRSGDQPAQLVAGLATGGPIDLSPPAEETSRTLNLTVNGATTPIAILLDGTTLDDVTAVNIQDIVQLINTQADDSLIADVVTVSEVDQIRISTRLRGIGASIQLSDDGVVDATGTTLDYLGFAPDNRNDTVTGGGTPFHEVRVESRAGLSVGDWFRLDDGLTQEWHQITQLETRTIEGIAQEFVIWDDRHESENFYPVTDIGDNILFTCEFDLNVSEVNPSSGETQEVETWEKLTLDPTRPNYALTQLNNEFAGSGYVVLSIPLPSRDPFNPRHNPAPGNDVALTGGTDNNPTSTDYTNARLNFDTVAIQLLSVLDDFVIDKIFQEGLQKAVMRGAIDYCGQRGDCTFVGHIPKKRDVAGAKAFGQNFRASKVYGALYWPWITVIDPLGVGSNPTKVVPPTGHVLGVYARIDQTRGVWKAPAGNEAIVRGALAVERDITDVDHTDLVKNGSVNGIRLIRGAGIVVDSSRTLSTDTRWLYVNVRLLFNYVKSSLRDGLRWVKQEPNRNTLWNKVKYNAVTPFLLRLYQSGAFGTGTPDEVFTVVCGPENNSQQDVDLGYLKVEVYFYPSKPAETIIIIVGQQPAGASASEQ